MNKKKPSPATHRKIMNKKKPATDKKILSISCTHFEDTVEGFGRTAGSEWAFSGEVLELLNNADFAAIEKSICDVIQGAVDRATKAVELARAFAGQDIRVFPDGSMSTGEIHGQEKNSPRSADKRRRSHGRIPGRSPRADRRQNKKRAAGRDVDVDGRGKAR